MPNDIVRDALAGARGPVDTGPLRRGDARHGRAARSARGATLGPLSEAKTLVIAEKPSVGRDLARVLPGPFQKHEGYLEGPEHVLTWAVGHLVQLAEPDEYDAKYKKWRMADLPIVPDKFKLVVRDERSKKQMSVVTKQLKRDDVDDGRQRLRRRPRGRADLRLPLREGRARRSPSSACGCRR